MGTRIRADKADFTVESQYLSGTDLITDVDFASEVS